MLTLAAGFPGGSEVKVSACNAGDLGLIPGLGRSPGEGNGNPLQCSCLENPRDGGAWWATVHGVAKSWTQLSDFTSLHSGCSVGSALDIWGATVEMRRLCRRSRKRLYLLGLERLGVHMQMGSRRPPAQERWRRLADPPGAEGVRGKELALRSLSGGSTSHYRKRPRLRTGVQF